MLRVLVIDDDDVDFKHIDRMLRRMSNRSYTVEWAKSFQDGLSLIDRAAADVYLVDHFLGSHTGLELIQTARRNGNDQALILLTGIADDEIEEQALQHGASDFLDKNHLTDYLLDRSIRFAFERHAFEKDKMHNERLITIGTMAASVAHQYNNLNTMVSGNLELLKRKAGLNPSNAKRLKHAIEAVDRSSGIANALLSFSSFDSSREASSLLTVAKEIRTLLNSDRKSCPIQIHDNAEDVYAVIDKNLIAQVVLNLCVNARHALVNKPDGFIEIHTGKNNEEAFLCVRDNGCGIPEKELPHIFTAFYSTKAAFSSHSKNQRGSGLGLSLSSTIVKNHGGRIKVDSQVGHGTSMGIYLPMASDDQKPSRVTLTIDKPINIGKKQIVIIDDERDICDILHNTLAEEDYSCSSFDDPQAGLERLLSEQTDLITIDQQMPGLSGQQIIERIRKEGPNQKTPIIIISGWLTDSDRAFAKQHNVQAVIEKPFTLDDVINQVGLTLNEQQTPS
jgi:signal transduction histidine kinase